MSKKSKIHSSGLIYLISFVWILGLALTGAANAADPDLIGWWKLNEGSGDVVMDFSGNDFLFHNIPYVRHKITSFPFYRKMCVFC